MDRNLFVHAHIVYIALSLSARRAWIEIEIGDPIPALPRSLSARRAWIEIVIRTIRGAITLPSLSARRAWIEIISPDIRAVVYSVALRKESVDRNRNPRGMVENAKVALRKESVDRNYLGWTRHRQNIRSLSARRAWIEI